MLTEIRCQDVDIKDLVGSTFKGVVVLDRCLIFQAYKEVNYALVTFDPLSDTSERVIVGDLNCLVGGEIIEASYSFSTNSERREDSHNYLIKTCKGEVNITIKVNYDHFYHAFASLSLMKDISEYLGYYPSDVKIARYLGDIHSCSLKGLLKKKISNF